MGNEVPMAETRSLARVAGVLYLTMSVLAVLSMFYFSPKFVVSGDAAATARHITDQQALYRLAIASGLLTFVVYLFLVWVLFELFESVDRSQARLLRLLVTSGIIVGFANLFNWFAPLTLLSGADYLSSFTKPQLESLAYVFLRLKSSAGLVTNVFWGLWLFPFGVLVMRSKFLPKWLGIGLILAGTTYPAISLTSILAPEYTRLVSRIMLPLEFGELPIIFWLLFGPIAVERSHTARR